MNLRFSNRSEFTRNIVQLVSGTAAAQFIALLVTPILTRLYSEEEFGFLALITSVFSVLVLVAGGRYEVALLLPKRKGDAANLFVVSLLCSVIFTATIGLIIVLAGLAPGVRTLNAWYYTIPLFVLALTGVQIMNAWFNRGKRYKAIATNRIATSVLNNGFALVFGFLHLPFNGLLAANLIGSVLTLGVAFWQLKGESSYIRRVFSRQRSTQLMGKYRRFPMVNSIQSVLDGLQINGLIYLITILFGGQIVGIFALALRMLFVPSNFIGTALAQVFYQEASEAYSHRRSLKPLVIKTSKRAALFISVVLVVIMLFGPDLFAFVFGREWYDAGVYARYIAPWVCLDFVRAPLSQIPLIFDRQRRLLAFSMVSNLFLLAFVVIIGVYSSQISYLLMGISALQVIYQLLLIMWIFSLVRNYERQLIHKPNEE